jgi:hypothetical protein
LGSFPALYSRPSIPGPLFPALYSCHGPFS